MQSMSNNPEHELIDPIIILFPTGKVLVRPSDQGIRYKGVKVDGKRPHLILYPEGVLNDDEVKSFEYMVHPKHGQWLTYKPTGAPYLCK